MDTDGCTLGVGTSEGCVQVWDVMEKTRKATLSDLLQQQSDVTCLSVGNKSLVTGSSDSTICLWSHC